MVFIIVLWALGWAMIVLSALVFLPTPVVGAFGILMIATHNFFDSAQSSNWLGPAMLFLWTVDIGTPLWLRPALIIGKVPMFDCLLHVPLIHLIAIAVGYARYGQVHWMFDSPTIGQFPITQPPGWGIPVAGRGPGGGTLWWRCTRSAAGSRN